MIRYLARGKEGEFSCLSIDVSSSFAEFADYDDDVTHNCCLISLVENLLLRFLFSREKI